jgi:hypothetical protein
VRPDRRSSVSMTRDPRRSCARLGEEPHRSDTRLEEAQDDAGKMDQRVAAAAWVRVRTVKRGKSGCLIRLRVYIYHVKRGKSAAELG